MFEIKNVMTKNVVSVKKYTPINEAIGIMVEKKVTGLPVVDDKMKLVGIITEKDVLMLLYNFGDRPGSVEDFMTRDIASFDLEDSLSDICECLLGNHFRRVPIVAGPKKKLVGIISRTDIIRCISHNQGFFRDTPFLPGQLVEAKTKIQLLKQQLEDENCSHTFCKN